MKKRITSTADRTEAERGKRFERRQRSGSSVSSPIPRVYSLQRALGNQALQKLFTSGVIQAKLQVGEPHDRYEQEADRVADQVMRIPESTAMSDWHSAVSADNASLRMNPG